MKRHAERLQPAGSEGQRPGDSGAEETLRRLERVEAFIDRLAQAFAVLLPAKGPVRDGAGQPCDKAAAEPSGQYERLELLLSVEAGAAIKEAAARAGQGLSDFAVSTLLEKAGQVLQTKPEGKKRSAGRYSFRDLMAGVTPENMHPEVKTGPAVGGEAL